MPSMTMDFADMIFSPEPTTYRTWHGNK
jgi:hypothetical protein